MKEEINFDDIDKELNKEHMKELKSELKKHKMKLKDLVKSAKKKMKEPGFMDNAKDKSAWCMNGMHYRCSGHFVSSKNELCQCPCHLENKTIQDADNHSNELMLRRKS